MSQTELSLPPAMQKKLVKTHAPEPSRARTPWRTGSVVNSFRTDSTEVCEMGVVNARTAQLDAVQRRWCLTGATKARASR